MGKQCSDCSILTQYADDTTYIVGNKSRQENQTILIRNLDKLSLFLNDNNLEVTQGKTSLTETMIKQKKGKIGGTPPSFTIQKQNGEQEELLDSQHTRILGANIQSNMAWQLHLETGTKALLPQLRKQLGMLRHHGKLMPKKTRLNLARGILISRLNNLLPIWGGVTDLYIKRAQVFLNSAARWATGMAKQTKVSRLMDEAGWFNIREQTRIATAMQSWKIVHLKKPMKMKDIMFVNGDAIMELQRPKLEFSENCFRWRAAAQWNELSPDMRQDTFIAIFKRRMKVLVKEDSLEIQDPG